MAEITSIFNFLKDYNDIRNPVITDIERQNWNYKLSNLPQIEELWFIYNTDDYDELKILEIERPTILPCSPPEKIIKEWIDKSWDKLSVSEIKYIASKTEFVVGNDGEKIEQIERFIDNKDRVQSFNDWIEKRNKWLKTERPKQEGLNLYNELYSQYSSFKREAESVEMILGDGMISWTTEGRKINHPVLLQKVSLEFNSNKPSFIVKCDEIRTELYTPMLRVIKSINQGMLSEIIKEVENQCFHISDKINNIGTYKRLINVIDESGEYVEINDHSHSGPVISYEPVLFLRKRNLGFTEFIGRIIEDIEGQEDIKLPNFFNNILGDFEEENKNNKNEDVIVTEDNWNQSGIDNDILLTLPANNEQMRIVKYLDNYGAVLVQGPPGTGKTHTIANLIGHLLSRGDSVLVTSHTEKALLVLKDKVFKELQSLCISLLSTSSERKEMDATLFEIAEKSTTLDKITSQKKIIRLESERRKLIDLYQNKNRELIQIRSLEYKDIVFGNTTIKPIEASKFIREGDGTLEFIPGIAKDDTILLPLSLDELEFLYKSNDLITKEEETLLNKNLPSLIDIWTCENFISIKDDINIYNDQLEGWSARLLLNEEISKEELLSLLDESKKVSESITKMEDYQKSIINKSIIDRMYNKFWDDVFLNFENLMIDYEEYRTIKFNNNYNIPSDCYSEDTVSILDEIIASDKEIPVNFFSTIAKPKWKKIRDSITNDNKSLEKKIDYENVRFIITYKLQKHNIINKTNKLIIDISNKESFKYDEPEEGIESFFKIVKSSLEWYQKTWGTFTEKIGCFVKDREYYYGSIQIDTEGAFEYVCNLSKNVLEYDLKNYYCLLLLNENRNIRGIYYDSIKVFNNYGNPFDKLIYAFEKDEVHDYGKYYDEIVNIYDKKELFLKRTTILEKLKILAPTWAKEINERIGIHGESHFPENIELAWKWRQLSNQIDRIDSYDPNQIQKDLRKINEELMINARDLAYEKAWYNKVKKNTDQQTQAIEAWRQTMRQIGKGTGKNAPMLREKARKLMPLCQTAIPVWIMPLNRVAENLDPAKNKFDVVIIDEASQADILALSALYLGKKIIIVGDDEQVSPESVGIKTEDIIALAEQHLNEIPTKHLFNGKTSIYDIAKISGFTPIMLVEHFRCLPEIIEFSNKLSYNSKIKPLRDASGVNIKPAVIEYRVPNGYRNELKFNPVEAEHIASIICSCTEDKAYKDKTIGVISLVGKEQAYEIDRILQTYLEPKEYEDRNIQCGTPAQFQGDERDIIFLSVVEGPKEGGGPLRLLSQDGNNDINRKKYNVAASRAKDQMWVVHSLNPEIDLQPEDIRLRLIKHAIDPSIDRDDGRLRKTESDFELKVMKDLLDMGYKVDPQRQVGAYRIDMVVEDGNNIVALECDGERWHTQDDLSNDLKRQAILERLGWRFIRIRGSAFYRNPEETMRWVYDELESYDVRPNFTEESQLEDRKDLMGNELIDGIKRRAEELRREWNANIGEEEDINEQDINKPKDGNK